MSDNRDRQQEFVRVRNPEGKRGRMPAAEKLPDGYTLEAEVHEAPKAAAKFADNLPAAAPVLTEADELAAHEISRQGKPWANIPGVKPEDISNDGADGDWYDGAVEAFKRADATLLPSASAYWREPSEDEAKAALAKRGQPATLKNLAAYRDAEWDSAYDTAQKTGSTLYRGSFINENSPKAMRLAKLYSDIGSVPEAGLRMYDRMRTLGAASAVVDSAGVSHMSPDAPADAQTIQNIKRGQRAVETWPLAGLAGGIAGALNPKALATKAATAMGSGVLGTAASIFGTEMAADTVANIPKASVGMELKPVEESLVDAGTAGVFGGALTALGKIPGWASKLVRSGDGADATRIADIEAAGGGFHWRKGLVPHDDFAGVADRMPGKTGAVEGETALDVTTLAINDAAEKYGAEGADAIARTEAKVHATLGSEGHGVVDTMLRGAGEADSAVVRAAKDLVKRGESIDTLVQDSTEALTSDIIKSVNTKIPAMKLAQGELEEAAHVADEGVPDVSLAPVIEKHMGFIKKLYFRDGEIMSNDVTKKLADAVQPLFEKRKMTRVEAKEYEDIAYFVKSVDEKLDAPGAKRGPHDEVEVHLPRQVNSRELVNMMDRYADLAKFDGAGAGGNSEGWKALRAEAGLLRGEFENINAAKLKSKAEIGSNTNALQALGLGNITPGRAPDVNQFKAAAGSVREILSGRAGDSSNALNPRVALERWAFLNDPPLHGKLLELKKLKAAQAGFKGINEGGDLLGDSTEKLVRLFKNNADGSQAKFDAFAGAVGMKAEERAVRDASLRANDLLKTLGVAVDGSGVDRATALDNIYRHTIAGGAANQRVINAAAPAQRKVLEELQKPVRELDKMMSPLGLGGGKWSGVEKPQLQDAWSSAIRKSLTTTSPAEFKSYVKQRAATDEAFKKAIGDIRSTSGFQHLRSSLKERVAVSGGGTHAYLSMSMDFFTHRLAGMMGKSGRGNWAGLSKSSNPYARSPVGAPAEYATAAADTAIQDEDVKLTGRQAFDAIARIVAAEEEP